MRKTSRKGVESGRFSKNQNISNSPKDNLDVAAGGVKYDTGKPRFDLLPWNALWEVAGVMEYGAQKYDDRNWERGMRFGRLSAAAFRHLARYMMGEEYDKESGYRHLAMTVCCILMLMGLSIDPSMQGFDDRSKLEQLGYVYRERV